VATDKPQSKLTRFLIQATPVIFLVFVLMGMSIKAPMWVDEYAFYRLASQFPDYSSTKDWFFEDRPEMLTASIDWEECSTDQDEAFHRTYDTPIYVHPPFCVMLMVPLVRGLNVLADNDVIPHIEDEPGYFSVDPEDISELRAEFMTNVLRIIPMVLFAVSLLLIYKLMRYKVGKNALFLAVPIAASAVVLSGNYLFYWDAFMMFFFVSTLYLMEMKPKSKWKYVIACFLVNTKIFIGIAFLLPLVILAFTQKKEKRWTNAFKMCLPALSIIPFYIVTLVITGDPIYWITRYILQIPGHNIVYTLWSWPEGLWTLVSFGVPFYLIMTAPIMWYFKKYPAYAIFWLLTTLYAWGSGLGITHVSTIMYSGAITFPLVANEWDLANRMKRWFKKKPKVEETADE